MYAYNTRKKTPQQLEGSLVGDDRWDLLKGILKELQLDAGESPKQHWMIIGPRGIGKSHLLTLLYYKVKENQGLMKLWLPILLPEDLRMVTNLSRLLERISNEILKELLHDKDPIVDELKERLSSINKMPKDERIDSFLTTIEWCHEKTGRHFILLIENLQQMFGRKINLIEQKKLRAFLQTSNSLLLIGSATTIFDAIHDHSKPFYNFFHTRRLKELDFADMKKLIINIISESNNPELIERVHESEARLKTLYSFTGGNPRMAVFLSDIIKAKDPDDMLDFMDNVLDQLTPYFESILNDTPFYMEEIINILAAYEPAQSPKEIAEHLETPQPTIRNYLKQLKDTDYIRIAFSKGKSNYYCLNEYLYRIWYQMRDSSHREETRWLIEMLLMLYSPGEIIERRRQYVSYGDLEEKTFPYKRYFIRAAEFIESNPTYCKIIEMCTESMIVMNNMAKASKEEKMLLQDANKYLNENQYDKAIQMSKEALRLNPNSKNAYLIWGLSLIDQRNFEEAIDKFQEVVNVATKSYDVYGIMGYCYMQLGQYADAEEKFKKGIEINKKDEHAYLAFGTLLRKQKRYDEASEKFNKAIVLNPTSDDAYWSLGACLRAQGRYEDAIDKFHEALKINSNSYPSYGAIGDCYRELGKFIEAEEAYKKAIKLNDKYDDAYRAWARLYRYQKRYDEAIDKYKKAIEINPKSESSYWYWGDCLRKQNNYEEAIEKFQEAIKIEPKSYPSYGAMGDCYRVLGQYEGAEKQYKKAIEIEEKYEDAYLAWGTLLSIQKRYAEAIELYKRVLEINQNLEDAYISWGCSLLNMKRYDEAMEFYKEHLYKSKDIQAIHLHGELLMNMGKYKDAEDKFKSIINVDPRYDQVHESYGDLLEKTNKKEQAILEYLRHLNIGLSINSEVINFQETYSEKFIPLLSTLNPKEYARQFYASENKDKYYEIQLSILLILLSKYDTVGEHIKDIIKTHLNVEDQKRKDFDLLIFTIKLNIWLKLCTGDIHEALRLVDLYLEYIRAMDNDRQKEKEIFTFSVSLFRVQLNSNIKPDDILSVLEHIQKSEGIPFRDVLIKIWTCLSDPDSVDAQRYMSEKAIEEVVKEIKKKKSSEAMVCDMLTDK